MYGSYCVVLLSKRTVFKCLYKSLFLLDCRLLYFLKCKYSASEMATYQKQPNGSFVATIRIKGYKPVSRSHRTRRLAETWAQPIEDEMRCGTYNKSKNDTLQIIFDKYFDEIVPLKKTVKTHKTCLANLAESLGHIRIQDLTANDIVYFVNDRLKVVKSSTVLKDINTLSVVINTAVAIWDYDIRSNPVCKAKAILKHTRALRQPPSRSRRLADGEEELLLGALKDSPPALLISLLTLETARRLNELMSSASEVQVREGRAYLRVKDNKTGDDLDVPLSDRAAELMKDRYLLNVRNDSISQAFARAAKRAGIDDLRLTDLRHEALSRLFEKGFDVPEVLAISGHKSVKTLLKIYTQVKSNRLGDKLNRLL